jgi:polar amino acid transport system substrate-binding protein
MGAYTVGGFVAGSVRVALLFGLALCGNLGNASGQNTQALWDKVSESGGLVCGAIPANPIGSYKVGTSENYEGYEINLCRQIALDLSIAMKKQINLKLQETSWSTVVLDLQSGKVDIWPGMSVTPERVKAIDMAGPMYELAHCAVNRKGMAGLKTWEDYSKPSVRIASVTGTSDEKAAREFAPNATILSFKETSEAILAIQAGRADAHVTNILTCIDILEKNPNVFGDVVIPTPVHSLPSSAGMRRDGDERFYKWLQSWAETSRTSGKVRWLFYDAMQRAGFDTSKIPEGFSF